MSAPEAWLRGPVEGVPAELQPVAHALLQAREDVREALKNFPAELLWTRPGGVASVGFHLQHMAGVVDRLFTYGRGETLTDEQRTALEREGEPPHRAASADELLAALDRRIEEAVRHLRATDSNALNEVRHVGRKQLPSTMRGLLFHAAEHVQRHVGQLLVTARVQR